MAVTTYNVGDSLLISVVVRNVDDLSNVILETQDGRFFQMSDAGIKTSALDMTAVGSIVADTTKATTVTGDPATPISVPT